MVCACPKEKASRCDQIYKALFEKARHQLLSDCGPDMDTLGGNPIEGEIYPPGKSQGDYSKQYIVDRYTPRIIFLRPAHIRKLIYPFCPERNQRYEACIVNAYRTSKKNGGTGCLPAPDYCSQFNTWLD